MKKLISVLLMICILLLISSCSGTTQKTTTTSTESTSSTIPQINLSDYASILDIDSLLPGSFFKATASVEGYGHNDLGLSDDESQVILYTCLKPYQIILGYLAIYDDQPTQAEMDKALRDEQGSITLFENKTALLVRVGGLSNNSLTVNVNHPNIGDLATYVEGTVRASGTDYYIKMLVLKVGKVYVSVCSFYKDTNDPSLVTLGQEISKRINNYSQ